MVKNKKGMFFTLIGIMIVTLLLVYVTARYGEKLSDRFPTENMRVNQVTNLVNDLESIYLPAAITAVSQNVLEGMVDYATTASPGTPYTAAKFRDDFSEVFKTGEIALPSSGPLIPPEEISPYVFDELINALESAYKVEFTEYNIFAVTINQADRFTLTVTIELNYVMTTSDGIKYNRIVNVPALVSIINLRDPWYAYRGGIDHPILRADPLLSGLALVQELLNSGSYIPDNEGLSYLERFAGEPDTGLNPNKLGIVSFLHPADVGIVSDASYADYTFHPWKGKCAGNTLYSVPSVPNFRINQRFVDLLSIEGIATSLPSSPCTSG